MHRVECYGFSWIPHVVRVAQAVRDASPGESVHVYTDRPEMAREMRAFAHMTGNRIERVDQQTTATWSLQRGRNGVWRPDGHPTWSVHYDIVLIVLPTNTLGRL